MLSQAISSFNLIEFSHMYSEENPHVFFIFFYSICGCQDNMNLVLAFLLVSIVWRFHELAALYTAAMSLSAYPRRRAFLYNCKRVKIKRLTQVQLDKWIIYHCSLRHTVNYLPLFSTPYSDQTFGHMLVLILKKKNSHQKTVSNKYFVLIV